MRCKRMVAIFMSVLAALALGVGGSAPAAAQSTASYRAELNQLTLDMRAMWGELERFRIETRYCLPPGEPSKAAAQAALAALEAKANGINARYNATKQGLEDFLKTNTRLYGELVANGVDPRDRSWWTRYETSRKKMLDELRAKKAALAKAREVDCSPRPKPKPVVAVTPPPPLPVRPVIEPIVWPALPPHFCSEAERWKFLVEKINPLYNLQAENAEKAARFRTQVEIQVNNRVQSDQPIPPALAALRRQAIADVAAQDREAKKSEGIYRRVKIEIPVIDCSPPPPQTEPPRTQPPQTEPSTSQPPATDTRTGRVPSGLDVNDSEQVARQQKIIEDVEAAINELQQIRAGGDCSKTWAEAEDIDEWLDDLSAPGAVSPVTGKPRPALPRRLIQEWDRRLDAIMKDCPNPRLSLPGNYRLYTPPPGSIGARILDTHNKERAAVGVAPLRWDAQMAAAASAYAEKLAAGGPFVHAPRAGRENERENLSRGLPGASAEQMMINWTREKSNFMPGTYPNVSKTGSWYDVSHYTQMIWPTTTHVGCGTAAGSKYEVLVCRYTPPGNRDGRPILADNAKPGPLDIPRLPESAGGGMQQIDPPPPPPPTAADEAPNGAESQHPLVTFFTVALGEYDRAARACDEAAMAKAKADMDYALQELKKRRKAARATGQFSTVKPAEVEAVIKMLEGWIRAAEEARRRVICPPERR